MTSQTQTHGSAGYFFIGLLIGGLAGSAAMLLMAPQSGKETRDQIQAKGIQLRDEATETVEKTMAQARVKGQQLSTDVREKAEVLQQRGQNLVNQQREHLSAIVSGENHEVDIS